MRITVFFPGARYCRRTFFLTETEPDHHDVISQLTEEIRALDGPLFKKMRKLPVYAISHIKEHGWSSLIVIDGTTYWVMPSGVIVYAFDDYSKILLPQAVYEVYDEI